MENKGRTRDKKLSDYYMTERDKKIVMDFLNSEDPDKAFILYNAVVSANDQIAKYIYISLSKNLSYEGISKKEFIPIGINDFYGYRRKAIYNVFELMKLYLKVK